MLEVELTWEYYLFEEGLKKGFDKNYTFYMIFLREEDWFDNNFDMPELGYIGMVTKQTVSDRLLSSHGPLISIIRDMKRDLILTLGKGMKLVKTGWPGVFKEFPHGLNDEEIKDTEAAMIAHFKPRFNQQGILQYKGQAITIKSKGDSKSWLDTDLNQRLGFTIKY